MPTDLKINDKSANLDSPAFEETSAVTKPSEEKDKLGELEEKRSCFQIKGL